MGSARHRGRLSHVRPLATGELLQVHARRVPARRARRLPDRAGGPNTHHPQSRAPDFGQGDPCGPRRRRQARTQLGCTGCCEMPRVATFAYGSDHKEAGLAFSYAYSVAVVTGAGSGIGAALSSALAARGADLALVDRDAAGLHRIAEVVAGSGRKVSQHVLDVTDAAAVEALPSAVLAAHGRVSILINNAGVALGGNFEEVRPEDFDWVMDVNFGGTVRMTRAFLPLLRRHKEAALVNLSSLFGLIAPPRQSAYCASKFAVRGFTEALRHELAGTSIRVVCVHPGGVATQIARNARRAPTIDDRSAEELRALAERLLTMPPAEAAETILRGLEAGETRLVVGKDATRGDLVQRLFPASYMKWIGPSLERQRRAAAAEVAAARSEE